LFEVADGVFSAQAETSIEIGGFDVGFDGLLGKVTQWMTNRINQEESLKSKIINSL